MKLLILFSFIFSYSAFAEEGYSCEEAFVDKTPFYVTDAYKQGERIWENFRDFTDPNVVNYYIPRGSITYVPPERYKASYVFESLLPAKVLALPNKNVEIAFLGEDGDGDTYWPLMYRLRDRERVRIGDLGFVHKKSLRKAGGYSYLVRSGSPSFNMNRSSVQIHEKYTIEFRRSSSGKYSIERCCTLNDNENSCYDVYEVNVYDEKKESVGSSYLNIAEDEIVQNLIPIPTHHARAARTLNNFFDELLYVYRNPDQSDLVSFPIDTETGDGPFGSFHYSPDDKYSLDAYAKPYTTCAYSRVLQKWQQECTEPGCQVHFGDMFHKVSWDVHTKHGSGECIDMRPFRKDDDDDYWLVYQGSRYSFDKTKRFIDLLKRAGGDPIIFNDRRIKNIYRDSRGVHDNHIHVCFKARSPKVRKACHQGL